MDGVDDVVCTSAKTSCCRSKINRLDLILFDLRWHPECLAWPFQPCRSTTPHVQPGYPVRRSDTPCSAAPLGVSSLASKEYSFEYAQPHCNRDEFNVS